MEKGDSSPMETTETAWDRWASFVHHHLAILIAALLVLTLPTLAFICCAYQSLRQPNTNLAVVIQSDDATTGRIQALERERDHWWREARAARRTTVYADKASPPAQPTTTIAAGTVSWNVRLNLGQAGHIHTTADLVLTPR